MRDGGQTGELMEITDTDTETGICFSPQILR